MLKLKEYAELKVGAIVDDMQKASGLTISEINQENFQLNQETIARMRHLGITRPLPLRSPDIRKMDSSELAADYTCVRRLSGKGMGKKAAIAITVFTSITLVEGKLWYHTSLTRRDRQMPTYSDLAWMKANFFPNTWAIQYFPTLDQHVSHHDGCLHLWTCLEGFEMPDFRKFGTI